MNIKERNNGISQNEKNIIIPRRNFKPPPTAPIDNLISSHLKKEIKSKGEEIQTLKKRLNTAINKLELVEESKTNCLKAVGSAINGHRLEKLLNNKISNLTGEIDEINGCITAIPKPCIESQFRKINPDFELIVKRKKLLTSFNNKSEKIFSSLKIMNTSKGIPSICSKVKEIAEDILKITAIYREIISEFPNLKEKEYLLESLEYTAAKSSESKQEWEWEFQPGMGCSRNVYRDVLKYASSQYVGSLNSGVSKLKSSIGPLLNKLANEVNKGIEQREIIKDQILQEIGEYM